MWWQDLLPGMRCFIKAFRVAGIRPMCLKYPIVYTHWSYNHHVVIGLKLAAPCHMHSASVILKNCSPISTCTQPKGLLPFLKSFQIRKDLLPYLMVNTVTGEKSMKQRSATQEAPRTEGATGRRGMRHTRMPATNTDPLNSKAHDPNL